MSKKRILLCDANFQGFARWWSVGDVAAGEIEEIKKKSISPSDTLNSQTFANCANDFNSTASENIAA